MYKDYNSKSNLKKDEMNPFELEGRNLKLFEAKTREEIKEIKENNNKKQSKRSKEFLYYGLSKESLNNCKLNEEITEEDKIKREKLIQIKKDNYYNNPNYHVSNTRLSLRNFEKNINEENIKKIIFDVLNSNKEFNKNYKNIKMIKQIKLLKEEENDKSKCVAFVECKDLNIAKFLIDNLSGFKFNEKSKKGLIIDFVLDDYRKKLSRERKLERIREIKKERKKEKKLNNNNNNNENKKVELNSINDINKLIDLYHTTLSRGKKQRIKKKLKNLGFNKNIPPVKIKKEINKKNVIKINNNNDEYESIKIVNNKTDLNKKLKEKNKNEKMIGKKKQRNEFFDDDNKEDIKNKKNIKKEKKQLKIIKDELIRKKNKFEMDLNESEENDDENIKEYYNKIMTNLNKQKIKNKK